jgi:superoxide dismutase, Cu-Zn family
MTNATNLQTKISWAGILLIVTVAVVISLLMAFSGSAGAQGEGATAQLEDTDGNLVGTADFVEGPQGVTINVTLQPGQQAVEPGEHGIHIHEKGDISPDFEAAGEHFNPANAQHGFNNPQGPHAGDLEDIVVNDDGSANYTTTNTRITLLGGENSILDSDGSALVIHQSADDYQTDPSGDSGDRVVAGIIREAATGEATTAGGTTSGPLPKSGGMTTLSGLLVPAAALLVGSGVLSYAVLRRR